MYQTYTCEAVSIKAADQARSSENAQDTGVAWGITRRAEAIHNDSQSLSVRIRIVYSQARSERAKGRGQIVIPAAREAQANARICPCRDVSGGDSGDRLVYPTDGNASHRV